MDGAGKCWDLASNQVVQYAQHEGAIKCVHWVEAHNMIVTGGWDKTLKFWPINSLGTGTPAATVNLTDRVYAMDVKGDCMVVALADRNIHVFDVRNNPSAPMKSHQSPLRHQVRSRSPWTFDVVLVNHGRQVTWFHYSSTSPSPLQ